MRRRHCVEEAIRFPVTDEGAVRELGMTAGRRSSARHYPLQKQHQLLAVDLCEGMRNRQVLLNHRAWRHSVCVAGRPCGVGVVGAAGQHIHPCVFLVHQEVCGAVWRRVEEGSVAAVVLDARVRVNHFCHAASGSDLVMQTSLLVAILAPNWREWEAVDGQVWHGHGGLAEDHVELAPAATSDPHSDAVGDVSAVRVHEKVVCNPAPQEPS
mmetsp:Transcript_11308/g.45954  ORF Transcript_11308/g.45954 Transcript_11308/m.45954 type:complete len:211 (-) Transcript_11308:934-1566(-)